jgi:hypothetical protein
MSLLNFQLSPLFQLTETILLSQTLQQFLIIYPDAANYDFLNSIILDTVRKNNLTLSEKERVEAIETALSSYTVIDTITPRFYYGENDDFTTGLVKYLCIWTPSPDNAQKEAEIVLEKWLFNSKNRSVNTEAEIIDEAVSAYMYIYYRAQDGCEKYKLYIEDCESHTGLIFLGGTDIFNSTVQQKCLELGGKFTQHNWAFPISKEKELQKTFQVYRRSKNLYVQTEGSDMFSVQGNTPLYGMTMMSLGAQYRGGPYFFTNDRKEAVMFVVYTGRARFKDIL